MEPWSKEENVRLYIEELNKFRKVKDERNTIARALPKASIDKTIKRKKMNFKATFTQSLPVTLRSELEIKTC